LESKLKLKMNVYNWRQLNEAVDSLIDSVRKSEFKDDAFIDLIATRMADINLVMGDTGFMLFDKAIAKRIIHAEIKKS